MTPEPGTGTKPPGAANAAIPPATRPAQPPQAATAPTSLVPPFSPPTAAKKQPAAKQRPAAATAPLRRPRNPQPRLRIRLQTIDPQRPCG